MNVNLTDFWPNFTVESWHKPRISFKCTCNVNLTAVANNCMREAQAQSKAKIYTENVSTAKRTFHCGSNVLLFHFLNSMNKKLRRKPLKAKQISPLLTFPMPKIQFFIVYQYFRCLFVNQWTSQYIVGV